MRRLKYLSGAMFVMATLCTTTTVTAQQPISTETADWGDYGNSKYEYTVCYPMNLLSPQREADNGDGRTFMGNNGATMRVWGVNNVMNWNIKTAKRNRMNSLLKEGMDFSYERQGKNFFVLSGTREEEIVYHKSILELGVWRSVELRYNSKDRAIWDPVVTRVASCLKHM